MNGISWALENEEKKMSIVKRIEPLSVMRVAGILYAGLGLVAGAMFSLVIAMGSLPSKGEQGAPPFPFRMLFGPLAIVVLPVFYGVLGALMTGVMSALYNVVAKWVGGIEVEVG
jgi:hypothetical protein